MVKTSFLTSLEELGDLTSHQIRKAFGGKALGLFEAKQLGISIPQTWLIGAEHFEKCSRLSSKHVEHFKETAMEYLAAFLAELRGLPDCSFAVRSSSQLEDSVEQSFAGIFETYLNVSKDCLCEAIAKVWESCRSPKVLSYLKNDFSLRTGVVIQPMVPAKYAGVCFSKHPSPSNVYENHSTVIEFAPTSGEHIVQGEVTPFRFSGSAESIALATDALWMDDLLEALEKCKNYHGYDIDIEFVVDPAEQLVIVQQRPVSRASTSHVLDLSHYVRKFKRVLLSLDIELLIDGCARFLAPYLELSISLERWMVMITHIDGLQELWVQKWLDKAVVYHLSQRFQKEHSFLEKLERRYHSHTTAILQKDYACFSDPKKLLESRFFEWSEFVTPLTAHYYAPMFILEAIHAGLLHGMKKIDPVNAENDFFLLGTFGISSMAGLLQEELRNSKKELSVFPAEFSMLPGFMQEQLVKLSAQYGFLKCHQPYEEGYTAQELFAMMREASPKEEEDWELTEQWHTLKAKYILTPFLRMQFERFRRWLNIRNQDMEYLKYAMLHSRPLFEEIASVLGVAVKDIWNSSQEMIFKAIERRDAQFLALNPRQNLAIYHYGGETRLTDHLQVVTGTGDTWKGLRGKKVFGEGKMEAIVKIAFSPQELVGLDQLEHPTVLVTGMTTPDFIPVLKKHFSALITDEGGILCHAAIVARESSIPCIVATRMATEVLKEGMRVCIDFDAGEIEVIDNALIE